MIVEPDPRPSPPTPADEPVVKPHPAARWTMPLVLAASGIIWGLIAHVLGRN